MADGGFLLGFMDLGIQMAINQVILYTSNERCCKKELGSLKELVISIELSSRRSINTVWN